MIKHEKNKIIVIIKLADTINIFAKEFILCHIIKKNNTKTAPNPTDVDPIDLGHSPFEINAKSKSEVHCCNAIIIGAGVKATKYRKNALMQSYSTL